MNDIEQYVRDVLHNIHAPASERERIETDLRSHLQEALEAGQAPRAVIDHMGTPVEVAAEFMQQVRLNYAGFWIRLLAFATDLLILIPFAFVLALLAQLFINLVVRQDLSTLDWILGAAWIALAASCILAVIGLFTLYFPIFEGRFGQTIGKRLLGLAVLKESGMPIGYKEAFLRRIPFYFDFMPLDALFIPFTAKKQRAFDIVARTVVVRQGESHAWQGIAAAAAGLAVVVALTLLAAFAPVNIEFLSFSRSRPGELSKSYAYFRGTEQQSVDARAGQVIHIEMNANVRSGSLEFKLINPEGRLIGGTTAPAPNRGDMGTTEQTVQQPGRYIIAVQGHDTSGSYDVKWSVR